MIVFHLLTVLVLPNPSSLVTQRLGLFVREYANLLLINTAWIFFSPGPSPTFYLEYQIEGPGFNDNLDLETHYLPENPKGSALSDWTVRRLSSLRFFALNTDRLERFLVPWLCRKHSGASALHIRHVIEKVAELERAQKIDTAVGGSEQIDLGRHRYECPQVAQTKRQDFSEKSESDSIEQIELPPREEE